VREITNLARTYAFCESLMKQQDGGEPTVNALLARRPFFQMLNAREREADRASRSISAVLIAGYKAVRPHASH